MFTRTGRLPGEGFYSQIPNHWIRDHRLTAMEFKILCFWASHEVGYRVTIQQTIAEVKEGRDAIYNAVAGLVRHGYLIRSQGRHGEPVGRGGKTKFAQVDYELGPAAVEQTYERNWGRVPKPPKPQVEPHPETPEAVDDPSVSAGQTASGFSVTGSAVTGKPDTKKNKVLEDQQPPPPEAETPPPADSSPEHGGGGGAPPSEINPDLLEQARGVLAAVYPTTGKPAPPDRMADRLAELLAARLAAGWTSDDAIDHLAGSMGSTTRTPYAIMRWRIAQNMAGPPPAPRPAPRQLPRRCGCLNGVVLVPNPNDPRRDTPRPCPNCRPAETSAA